MKKHLKKLKTSFKKINYRILRTTHLVIFGLGIFSLVCLIFLETKKGYASSTTDYGYKIKKEGTSPNITTVAAIVLNNNGTTSISNPAWLNNAEITQYNICKKFRLEEFDTQQYFIPTKTIGEFNSTANSIDFSTTECTTPPECSTQLNNCLHGERTYTYDDIEQGCGVTCVTDEMKVQSSWNCTQGGTTVRCYKTRCNAYSTECLE